jgi:hypothetical protein
MSERADEARATYERYVEARGKVERGEVPWSALAEEYFTEDAVYIDPAWGRYEGRDAIARFMDESMQGLDGWVFPEEWTMVSDDGDRIVSHWFNRLPGERPDGSPWQAPGVSILDYAGDGKFSRSLDLLNMAEIMELIEDSGWVPSGPLNAPPKRPDRNPHPAR